MSDEESIDESPRDEASSGASARDGEAIGESARDEASSGASARDGEAIGESARVEGSAETGTESAPAEAVTTKPARAESGGAREVEVPLRLYKTVTVFATLIAMVAVILGFVALDVATNRAQAAASEVDVWVAVLGLGSILFGAFVYAFSTRFRTREMGKSKDESDEEPDNG